MENKRNHRGVTGDNMRDPCPGYRFDIITGEKVSTNVKAGGSYVKGSNDYAVNVPLSVSGLGVSQPRGIVLEGVSTGSARLLRENCRTHVRTGLEPKERFEMPYTSAMVNSYVIAQINLYLFVIICSVMLDGLLYGMKSLEISESRIQYCFNYPNY